MGTGDTQVAEAAAEQGIGAVGVAQGGDAAFASLLARHANSVAAQETRGGVGTASSPPGLRCACPWLSSRGRRATGGVRAGSDGVNGGG